MRDTLEKYAGFIDLLKYYETLCDSSAGGIPTKVAVRPSSIMHLLPYISMTEKIDERHMLIRLTGTALDSTFATNLTGKNVFDYYQERDIKLFEEFYSQISDGPYGGFSLVNMKVDKVMLRNCASLYLPLASTDGETRFFLNMSYIEPLDPSLMEDVEAMSEQSIAKVKAVKVFNLFDAPKYSLVGSLNS